MAREFINGGCLDISGGTQKASWGNVFTTTDPISAAFLFKLRANGSSNYDVVWGHSNDSWYFLLKGAAGEERKLAFVFRNSGNEKSSGWLTNNLTLDVWYVVIATHNSAGGANNTTLAVYTASDGVLVERITATNAFTISTSALALVAGYDSNRTISVNAQYKKFSIWNRVLSTGEQDAFALNQSVSRTSLLLETLCNEADGTTTLRDSTTLLNAIPATLSGSASMSPNIPSPFAKSPRVSVANRFYIRNCGTCLSFDGSTTYVQKSTETAYNLTNYSIAFWVKGASGQADKRLFAEGSSGSNNPFLSIGTTAAASSKIYVFIRDNSNATKLNAISTTVVMDNSWHSVVFTDANGTAKLYIDSIQDATSFSYTRGTLTLNRTGIGALIRGAASNVFNGKIDDVVVFNTALSLSEVQDYHFRGIRKSGSVIDYKFDEGSGNTATDSSGNSSNGDLTGHAPTYSTDPFIPARTLIP